MTNTINMPREVVEQALLPCPFCGEAADLHVYEHRGVSPDAYVQCRECTTCGPDGGDRAGAILKWNQRVALSAQADQPVVVPQDCHATCNVCWGENGERWKCAKGLDASPSPAPAVPQQGDTHHWPQQGDQTGPAVPDAAKPETQGERAELIRLLREDAEYHREVASDCDCRPEDTANWQHALRCEQAAALLAEDKADEAETLRYEVQALENKLAELRAMLAEDKGGEMVDTAGAFPEWKAGTSSFKQWCAQYFGPDADESYLAEAVLQLPRKQILPMKAADEFELHRLLAEERYTVRQLNRALRDATEPPTFMGEPVTHPQQQAAQAAVPQGWKLIEVNDLAAIVRDIRQHIAQGVASETLVASQRPGYGTGIYTHLAHRMDEISAMLSAAPGAAPKPQGEW